ncbi:MAG: hypothetical protein ACRCT8_12550 [Lacipirellulaceae bacterium]
MPAEPDRLEPPLAPRRPRDEWRVVAAVLVALAVCEGGMRAVGARLSADVANYHAMPAVAAKLAASDDFRVLVIGNSLVRDGVDQGLLAERLGAAAGRRVAVAKLQPDDTSVVEWRRLVERYVEGAARGDRRPADLVVLGYAQNQLTDAGVVRPRRLGARYATTTNALSLLTDDVTRFDDQFELLLASVSTAFSEAERVRVRVLDTLVPDYRVTAQLYNRARRASKETVAPASTYVRLERLVDGAKASGARLVVVAIPVGAPFEVDPALLALLSGRGVTHVDARTVPGITVASFPDGYHMDEAASRVFTTRLAEGLTPMIDGR